MDMLATIVKQSSTRKDNLTNRMYFLDNLRSFIILLVVVYHAAIAYMIRGPQWYYVVDTQNNFFFNIIVIFSDVFVMPVMFLLAGFFAIRSLSQKRQLVFWQEKIVRIVMPYFAGIIFLAPAINYVYFLSRFDTPPAYLDYWGNIFFG
jgi:peptidoglycan/LPS O-acetylase OafA/YrhL